VLPPARTGLAAPAGTVYPADGWIHLEGSFGIPMNGSPQVLQYFSPALFSSDLKASSKDEALEKLVAIVNAAGGVRDPRLLREMLRQRELLGSTGLGKGVAIPHGRSLAVVSLKVVFAICRDGLDFDSVDGKPVKLIFLIVAPPQDKGNEYLPLLGKIAELVQDSKVRTRLGKVQNFDQLKELMEETLGRE
jgi:fructose-specific phosphotransferase system IIA component